MPGNLINSESKMDALEIEDELADVVKEAGRDGLRFKDGARIFDLDYDRFYLLAQKLVELGRFKVERSQAGNENRLFLPFCAPPAKSSLSAKQREVLDLLCSEADDESLVSLSYAKIAARTGCRCPVFALERLDYKGFLEVLESGRGSYANLYRVYPNRDGPRGYSWPRPIASPSR